MREFFKLFGVLWLVTLAAVAAAETDQVYAFSYENALATPEQLKDFSVASGIAVVDGVLQVTAAPGGKNVVCANRSFPAHALAGRLVRVSIEAMSEDLTYDPTRARNAGVMAQFSSHLEGSHGKVRRWEKIVFPKKPFAWKKFTRVFFFPENLAGTSLNLGLQDAFGTVKFRNLSIEPVALSLNIAGCANMGLQDKVAGDGKGGWTDQGPGQDGREFAGPFYQNEFAGVPLHAEPEGKGILALRDIEHLENAPASAKVSLRAPAPAKALYVLHAKSWGPHEKATIGQIRVTGANGKVQEFPITIQENIGDWYRSIAVLPNGFAAVRRHSGQVAAALYMSRFPINADIDAVSQVEFVGNGKAIWLIAGASLSPVDIPLPSSEAHTITAGKQWLPMPVMKHIFVKPGSALDLSPFMPPAQKIAERLVITPDGHFVREGSPDKPLRFLCCTLHGADIRDLSREQLRFFVEEIRRCGFNLVRTHFLDTALMEKAQSDLDFDMKYLDNFDYFVNCLKENGIYLNMDMMTSWLGYRPGNMWKTRDPLVALKGRIYFEKAVRENWSQGVEKLICRVNQYTGTRLIDDPVLAMVEGFNEMEFGISRPFAPELFTAPWQKFLEKKYGTIEALKKKWGARAEKFTAFTDIPCFKASWTLFNDDDIAQFVYGIDSEIIDWFQSEMKRLGYRGPLTNFNCGKNMQYNLVRHRAPFVTINAYFAHPTNFTAQNSCLTQASNLGESAKLFRDIVSSRETNRPLVVTEHGIVFWNRYRYEQAFTVGAYGALQNIDGLTCHAGQVRIKDSWADYIMPFFLSADPIHRASELMTHFLFVRGDVKSAAPRIRLQLREKDVMKEHGNRGGMAAAQSLLALVAQVSHDIVLKGEKFAELAKNETALKVGESSKVIINDAGFVTTADKGKNNIASTVKYLQEKGLITAANRTNGVNIFESSTGELYLDSSRSYMEVKTPRFQGICAEAGAAAELGDLSVGKMTRGGCLSLIAIDGMKDIKSAGRLLLVYATNALNSGMSFADKEMTTLLKPGKLPNLLEQGAFTVTVRNANAADLRLYPLSLTGERLKEIAPVSATADAATFSVDTAKDGTTVFFEIVPAGK